jgi:O-antigen/teichoic acid export membrane protein
MSGNSKLIKNSVFSFIKLIVVAILGLLSSRFVLQALGPSDYGLFNVVGGIVFMMAFLNNVMVSSSYRFIAFELGKGDQIGVRAVYNICLVIHSCLALLLIILAETVGVYYIRKFLVIDSLKLGDAIFVFRCTVYSTVFSILSVPSQGLINAKENFGFIAIVEIFRSILALLMVVSIISFTGDKLRWYAMLISIISILPPISFLIYSYKKFPSIVKWYFIREKEKYFEILNFSAWILFGAAASAGEIQGSIILINLFFGTLINASFGIANQVNTMVKMVAQSLNQTAIPQITKSFSGNDLKRMMSLVIFTSKFSFFLMLIPSLPILLETDFILKLWLKEVPNFTNIFIQILILNALITTMSAGIPAAIQASGKIKYFMIVLSSTSLLGLPIIYYLFKSGIPAIILPYVYLGISIINFFTVQILLKIIINFDVRTFFIEAYAKMILVVLAVLPLFGIHFLFNTSLTRFLLTTVGSEIWLIIVVFMIGLNKIERQSAVLFLSNIFKNKIQKTTVYQKIE